MRRVVPALVLAAAMLTAAACGTARSPGAAAPAGSAAPAPATPAGADPSAAQTRALCETLGQVYSEHLGPFAEALSATVADSGASRGAQAQQQARQQLKAMGDAVLEATRANPDAQIRADGEQAAEQLRKTSTDDGFFRKIKDADDVNTVMGTTVKTWMEPVSRHCS